LFTLRQGLMTCKSCPVGDWTGCLKVGKTFKAEKSKLLLKIKILFQFFPPSISISYPKQWSEK
jgi:hypothetical protein